MSKIRPLPQPPRESTTSFESGDPLTLGPRIRRKRFNGLPLLVVGAGAVVVLAVVGIVCLWIANGRSALAPLVGTVQPEPDPPVSPPPAKELLKPSAGDLPSRMSLDARLEAIVRAAADVPEIENRLAINDRIGRWEIRFPNGNTAETYAKQLDALGIELGAIGGQERISYASHFTKGVPETREGTSADERRFYMTWRSGALRNLDNALLSRAKISTTGRIVAQFYPPQVETKMSELEEQFAAPRSVNEVRRTVFALVPDEKSFNVRVAEQDYVSGQVKSSESKAAGAKPTDDVPQLAPRAKSSKESAPQEPPKS